jgi:hypothetical protein
LTAKYERVKTKLPKAKITWKIHGVPTKGKLIQREEEVSLHVVK